MTTNFAEMDIPPQPDGFELLCERVGLAMMLGQKVQFALAGYHATFHRVKLGASAEDAKAAMDKHLAKPMGVVVAAIEKSAPLPEAIWGKVKAFKDDRNWLVHDFDEEATPLLAQGQHIREYTDRMDAIARAALELMQLLDGEGRLLAGS